VPQLSRPVVIGASAFVVSLLAIPVLAFAIVPHFARSTLHEAQPPVLALPVIDPVAAAEPAPPTPEVVASGGFRRLDPVHFGTGTVSIVRTGSAAVVRFQEVEINAAPRMYVYLSERSDGSPGRFIDLGPLKATSGSFSYELADSVDLGTIHSVVLWCRPFGVTVTYAVLNR